MAKAPTKQELIDALTKQGVALTGKETIPQLKALVAEHSTTAEQAQAEEGPFTVLDSNGKPFREVKTKEEADYLANYIGGRIKTAK